MSVDPPFSFSRPGTDLDAHPELAGEGLLKFLDVSRGLGSIWSRGGGGWGLDQSLQIANRKPLGDYQIRQALLLEDVRHPRQHLRVAEREAAVPDKLLDR